MKIREYDVVVVGAGLAGERAAIEAKLNGANVAIISLVPPRQSHTMQHRVVFNVHLIIWVNIVKGIIGNYISMTLSRVLIGVLIKIVWKDLLRMLTG